MAFATSAGLQAGDTVLVTGAGGGLGIHGVQVAKLCGAYVVALTTTPAKEKAIRAVGADEVVVVTAANALTRSFAKWRRAAST